MQINYSKVDLGYDYVIHNEKNSMTNEHSANQSD